jgi:hypothetical protein
MSDGLELANEQLAKPTTSTRPSASGSATWSAAAARHGVKALRAPPAVAALVLLPRPARGGDREEPAGAGAGAGSRVRAWGRVGEACGLPGGPV